MKNIFLIALFATLIITRIWSHLFHDRENYGTEKDSSKTVSGWLRKKTQLDWHHIHFGLIILLIVIPLILLISLTTILTIFLAIGLSFTADQITPLIDKKSGYFSMNKLLISIMLHIVIALIAILIFISF